MMKKKDEILNIAKDSTLLDERISANMCQQIDLNQWIFSNIEVPSNGRVLELCCGTGAQTICLANIVNNGHVTAIDISANAITSLNEKIKNNGIKNISAICVDIDSFSIELENNSCSKPYFDLIFCSYGLYYSSNVSELLPKIKQWLKHSGSFIVVGPFGPNNYPLYELLENCKVSISEFVMKTSSTFMYKDLMPWAALNFERVDILTMVNPVVWTEKDTVMSYWKSSTFYDPQKRELVEKNIVKIFDESGHFINEKWVMLVKSRKPRKR